MTRLFLTCPADPGRTIRAMQLEVVSWDKARHLLVVRWPDGHEMTDTNFHIDIAKRVGYSLTAEIPTQFRS